MCYLIRNSCFCDTSNNYYFPFPLYFICLSSFIAMLEHLVMGLGSVRHQIVEFKSKFQRAQQKESFDFLRISFAKWIFDMGKKCWWNIFFASLFLTKSVIMPLFGMKNAHIWSKPSILWCQMHFYTQQWKETREKRFTMICRNAEEYVLDREKNVWHNLKDVCKLQVCRHVPKIDFPFACQTYNITWYSGLICHPQCFFVLP